MIVSEGSVSSAVWLVNWYIFSISVWLSVREVHRRLIRLVNTSSSYCDCQWEKYIVDAISTFSAILTVSEGSASSVRLVNTDISVIVTVNADISVTVTVSEKSASPTGSYALTQCGLVYRVKSPPTNRRTSRPVLLGSLAFLGLLCVHKSGAVYSRLRVVGARVVCSGYHCRWRISCCDYSHSSSCNSPGTEYWLIKAAICGAEAEKGERERGGERERERDEGTAWEGKHESRRRAVRSCGGGTLLLWTASSCV